MFNWNRPKRLVLVFWVDEYAVFCLLEPMSEMSYDYDVLIVGSGPAGQQAALQAARMGRRAAIIERKPKIGGAGLQTGTIPSKALREAAYYASHTGGRGMREAFSRRRMAEHGLLAEAIHRKEIVIAQQEAVILNRLLRFGVALIPGEASFVDAHALEIKGAQGETRRLSADVIILATGSRPRRPPEVPFDKQTVLDSTSILKIRHLPKSLLVAGGGVIACEFVSIFAALGVEITIVDSHAQLLEYLSQDVVGVLEDTFRNMGVTMCMRRRMASVRREDGQVVLTLEDGEELHADALLYALGREPNFNHLHVDKAGIDTKDGWIEVDGYFRTNVPHIYAVGDLIGRPALASTGMEQGRMAVLHAFGKQPPAMPANLPMAIYTIPEISYVGQTEKELTASGIDYVIGRGYYRDSARGQIIGDANGLLKLNVERATRRLAGVHIVGEHASELIHIGQLLMNAGGTVDELASNVFNYPTLAECYKLAAVDCLQQLEHDKA